MNHSRRIAVGGLLAALLAVGCAPIHVDVDYEATADFSGYREWGWLPEPVSTGNPRVDDPELHQLIRAAIEAQLSSDGFVTGDDPQIRVGYHLSTEEHVDVRTVSSPYGYSHWEGRNVEVRAETSTYVTEYERGRLVIDIVDTARNALVWRGVGERRLRRAPTPGQMTKSVNQAVAEILESFPPGGSR